jgi:apolipoprotein N-acyltransferase
MSASESGMGVLLLTLPTVLAEIVFLLASLLALVSLWEGRPVRSDPAARILVWALILVWLGIVVLGLPGLVAGATEQASTPVAQRVSIGLCVAVAVAAIASLPSRASGRR